MNKTENLQTVSNFAKAKDKSVAYIYSLIRDSKITSVRIDGVIFVPKNTVIPKAK